MWQQRMYLWFAETLTFNSKCWAALPLHKRDEEMLQELCWVAGCKTNEPTDPHPCFPSIRGEKVLRAVGTSVLFFISGSGMNSF